MLQLTNADLPDSAMPPRKAMPAFRIYKAQSHPLAPLVRFDRYGKYLNPGFDVVNIPLSIPNFKGFLYRVTLPFPLDSTPGSHYSVSDGTIQYVNAVTDSLLLPDSASKDIAGQALNINSMVQNDGTSIEVEAIAITATPEPDADYNYSIDLSAWGSVLISFVEVGGLRFTPAANPSSPQTTEFTFIDGTLKLYGGSSYRVPAFETVFVHLSATFVLGEATAIALTFNLEQSSLSSLDGVDYLGITFNPAQSASNPQVYQFLYHPPILTLFAPAAVAQGVRSKAELPFSGNSSISELIYQTWS